MEKIARVGGQTRLKNALSTVGLCLCMASVTLPCGACVETKAQQFNALYSVDPGDGTKSIDAALVCPVLNTCGAGWNGLAVRHNGATYVLESGIKDSYFKEAEECDLAVHRVAAGDVYAGGYRHLDQSVTPKPGTTVTMLDILFLRLNDIPKAVSPAHSAIEARSVQLEATPSTEDLTDLYKFQAAMMQMCRRQKGLDPELPEALVANIGAYATACSKCVTRLKKYMDYCPTVASYHREGDKFTALQELEDISGLLTPDAQILLRRNFSTDEDDAEAERLAVLKKAGATSCAIRQAQEKLQALEATFVAKQTQGIMQLHSLLFTKKNSNAQKYVHSIDHTEIMLHVLKQAGALSPAADGRVLVSGKCPCASCAAFMSSNDADVLLTFGSSVMIGYNYGWSRKEQKVAYPLNCVQLVSPTKARHRLWSNHPSAHVLHMGTTPIGCRTHAPVGLKVYVIGASFGVGSTIVSAGCTASPLGRGPCIIGGRVQPIEPTDCAGTPLLRSR